MNALPCSGGGEVASVDETAVSDRKQCHYQVRWYSINTYVCKGTGYCSNDGTSS